MSDDKSFVIRRTSDYYIKPLLLLFASVVVFALLQMVFVAEVIVLPMEDIINNLFVGFFYLVASLASVLIFIISFVLFITVLFTTAPRYLTVTESSLTYHGIKGTIIIPRAELASVRITQESSEDIKRNRGTVYLRSIKDEVINFGRVDNISKLAPILRNYVKDTSFNAMKEYYS